MPKAVSIIGCGISGPVLAMLLKRKGFSPVVYERHPEVQQAGLALGVSPQTLKVLNILGLAEQLLSLGQPLAEMTSFSQVRQEVLGRFNISERIRASLGWPMLMVTRTRYCEFLRDSARERGIEILYDKRLLDVKQDHKEVTARFQDGTSVQSDLLVGCDGLHSTVRNVLFGGEEAHYMGLEQIGGFSPIPEVLRSAKPTGYQVFGDGAHFVCAPVSSKELVWAATLPQPAETREDWRGLRIDEAREMIKALPVASWANGPKEVIEGATFITKFGLYDRSVLNVWHKGRVVLVGDAAHPTSPHLGQGANQAMEDCYHLVRLLSKMEPATLESLESVFTEYEQLRIPIVTKSVAQAKNEGERRVLSGRDACIERDEAIINGGGVNPERAKLQFELIKGPFTGESEI